MSTKTVDFRETVAAATGVENRKPCPIAGYVSAVIIHWPPGCAALVGVALIHEAEGSGGKKTGIVPTDVGTFLALDDTTPTFNINFPVKMGDYFLLIIRNADGVNPHTISVDIIINPELKPTPPPSAPPTAPPKLPTPIIPKLPLRTP